jgi:hypothetical protein
MGEGRREGLGATGACLDASGSDVVSRATRPDGARPEPLVPTSQSGSLDGSKPRHRLFGFPPGYPVALSQPSYARRVVRAQQLGQMTYVYRVRIRVPPPDAVWWGLVRSGAVWACLRSAFTDQRRHFTRLAARKQRARRRSLAVGPPQPAWVANALRAHSSRPASSSFCSRDSRSIRQRCTLFPSNSA